MGQSNPEYPGDNENREFVRAMMSKKGFTVDRRKLIMRLPKRSVDILFLSVMRREFPDYA